MTCDNNGAYNGLIRRVMPEVSDKELRFFRGKPKTGQIYADDLLRGVSVATKNMSSYHWIIINSTDVKDVNNVGGV